MSATLPSAALPLPLDKIRTRHRDRNAVVYVRQSTARQVRHSTVASPVVVEFQGRVPV